MSFCVWERAILKPSADLEAIPERARRLTEQPILLRLDGGNDAIENIEMVLAHNEQDAERAAVIF